MTQQFGPIFGHGQISWFESERGLVAVDTGWDLARGEPFEESEVEALVEHADATGKPLTHVLLTHDHADHRANLPFLRSRWPTLELAAHPAGAVDRVTIPLEGGEWLEIDGVAIEVLHTPGHSATGDELSYYLPEAHLLFCGDVAQPQGPSYSVANGVSPVPFFHDGAAYRATLERLIELDPQRVRTGHDAFLGPEQARQWLRVTLATLTRIEELAIELVDRYPDRDDRWLAEAIYEQIADERHFGFRRARARMTEASYPPLSDFERFDLPGILDAVRRAR